MNYYALDEALCYINNDDNLFSAMVENFTHIQYCNEVEVLQEITGKEILTKIKEAYTRVKNAVIKFFKWLDGKLKKVMS